jgi:hypothetical protein
VNFIGGLMSETISDVSGFHLAMKEMYPNGVNLYHRTQGKSVTSILKEGLKPLGKYEVVHTVFGCPHVKRVEGDCILEIKIPVDMYVELYPEENSYLDREDFDVMDGDERDDISCVRYLYAHSDFMGGDITLMCTVPPEYISVYAFSES